MTGASSGFGKAMAEYCLSQGDKVVATLRKPEALNDLKAKYSPSDLLILKLDVNNRQEIADAFSKVKDTFGRIDVVFNNAAWSVVGELESTKEETARALFETDFWGATHVSLEAVKFFREVNKQKIGGTLVVNSSMVGYAPAPGIGYFSAAKAALEAVHESLLQELDPAWNIKVTLIEPGSFKTNGIDNTTIVPAHPAYTNPALPANFIRHLFENAEQIPMADAMEGVKLIHKLTLEEKLPLRFALGTDSVASFKAHTEAAMANLEAYGSWSSALGAGLPVM